MEGVSMSGVCPNRMSVFQRLKKVVFEALIGFVLWTAILTPYVLFVTQMTFNQYLSWLLMQAIIVPPVAVVVLRITNRFTRRLDS